MENLIQTIQEIPKDKSVFVFDLDGTLAESKVNIDSEMGDLLAQLLVKGKVAIIGGASFKQMASQLPESISKNSNLFLLPLDGGSFYKYPSTSSGQVQNDSWQEVYKHELSLLQKKGITEALARSSLEAGYLTPAKTYGTTVEDRGSQVTWSALGQEAPLEEKQKWNQSENGLRLKIVTKLKEYLPNMESRVAGLTSIDVTPKGIDKKYGVEQIIKHLNVSAADVLFFGDTLEPEGNDYPALEARVACYMVSSVEDTKKAIEYLLD